MPDLVLGPCPGTGRWRCRVRGARGGAGRSFLRRRHSGSACRGRRRAAGCRARARPARARSRSGRGRGSSRRSPDGARCPVPRDRCPPLPRGRGRRCGRAVRPGPRRARGSGGSIAIMPPAPWMARSRRAAGAPRARPSRRRKSRARPRRRRRSGAGPCGQLSGRPPRYMLAVGERLLREGPAPEGTFDVAIVGAGAVGCAVARDLTPSRRPLRPDRGRPRRRRGDQQGEHGDPPHRLRRKARDGRVAAGGPRLRAARRVRGAGRHPGRDARGADGRLDAGAARGTRRHPGRRGRERLRGDAPGGSRGALRARAEPRRGRRGGDRDPGEGIVCPFTTTLAFATEALAGGCELVLNAPVTGVRARAAGTRSTRPGAGPGRVLVNAAGLRSERSTRCSAIRDVHGSRRGAGS